MCVGLSNDISSAMLKLGFDIGIEPDHVEDHIYHEQPIEETWPEV